jgi:glycine dehydrogenase
MLRYIHRLQSKDLSLTAVDDPAGLVHDEAQRHERDDAGDLAELGQAASLRPAEQAQGYREMFEQLESWLAEITGFAAVSLQPNAGSQGEYAGLLAIRATTAPMARSGRDVCLIPLSAHGTNPASAVMAGMKVVVVACDEHGNIDVDDLKAKAESTPTARRADGDLPVDPRRVRGAIARSAPSSTSTAGRSTWTART